MKNFLIIILSLFLIGYTFEYQADYLGVISQINIPVKDLKIYLLDTRQLITEPFGTYIKTNNLIVKSYGVAAVKISTGAVLKMFFFDDLVTLKQKVKDYVLAYNINLTWKTHTPGQSIKDWWGKAIIQ